MDETITPYELPDTTNHSFFFLEVRIPPAVEAKLHRHDAWELLCVIRGYGKRTAGDTVQTFTAGDVALIPPGMIHRWAFAPDSIDADGHVHYLMVAFSHGFVERCLEMFPEVRNRLRDVSFPPHALHFMAKSAATLRNRLLRMRVPDELERLCEMLRLLPELFTAADHSLAGKPMRIERDVQRMQQICTYVMLHYTHPISLNDIATEAGMNRSAFCSWFKRCKGMTFSQFVRQYRLHTACELLKSSDKHISEICYLVGFNDLPHFVRAFKQHMGVSPSRYREQLTHG